MKETAVLLHDIRSAHNVGSIFRTAEAAGVSRLYISGYTPLPQDRFGRVQKEIAKVALGAEHSLSWQRVASPKALISTLKRRGWTIIGVEQHPRSVDYRKCKLATPALFVFGHEVTGVSRSLLKACDAIVEIPMHGAKESLNVAVAAGVVLFSVR
ncbi:MAG: hypothetical protein RLZZ416_319 [Candidatus Parcubacteria bacterium]|jgi:tRNA G18 (ribose-2'-O)-methylase SpoU